MTTDPDLHAKPLRPSLDHAPRIDPVHRFFRKRAGTTGGGAEEGRLATVANAGGLYIGVEISFQIVMRRHLVPFAAFLVQTDPLALAP